MNKGQVSLEYMMTYGIVIAIVVIAVAALYSFGVFGEPPIPETEYLMTDEEIQKEMCSTLCNNIGEDFNYYGVGLNKDLADKKNNYKGKYECYCSRTYLTGDENNTYEVIQVRNYGTLLDVVKIENDTE